jgi:hypothetical protein
MTLVEVMVALTILALALGIGLTFLGPWLTRERSLEREGRFWQESESAQTALTEIAAGAIDPANTVTGSEGEIRLRTFVPRLSPTPVDVQIRTSNLGRGDDLEIAAPFLRGPDHLISDGPPLRVSVVRSADGVARALVVETRVGATWTPLVVAPFLTNAPLQCAFDLISQACR